MHPKCTHICVAQIYVALTEAGDALKYEVYTAQKHTYTDYEGNNPEERSAVGMTDGLAQVDNDAEDKAVRERCRLAAHASVTTTHDSSCCSVCRHFPLELSVRALDIQLQDAKASMPEDRNRILNTIARRAPADLTKPADAAHP